MGYRVIGVTMHKPGMHPTMRTISIEKLAKLEGCCSKLVHSDPVEPQRTDVRPWSRVARARNALLKKHWDEIQEATHILWIDGDILIYDPDLATRLLKANDQGVSAPMVMIEDSQQFYDWAAFILPGTSHIQPKNRFGIQGRNINNQPPYFPAHLLDKDLVPMDCVGAVTLVNTEIYKAGVRYTDHPAFTDHFPICHFARQFKRPVTCDRTTFVSHAELPKYGEAWH